MLNIKKSAYYVIEILLLHKLKCIIAFNERYLNPWHRLIVQLNLIILRLAKN